MLVVFAVDFRCLPFVFSVFHFHAPHLIDLLRQLWLCDAQNAFNIFRFIVVVVVCLFKYFINKRNQQRLVGVACWRPVTYHR